jgi:hypothetical protein
MVNNYVLWLQKHADECTSIAFKTLTQNTERSLIGGVDDNAQGFLISDYSCIHPTRAYSTHCLSLAKTISSNTIANYMVRLDRTISKYSIWRIITGQVRHDMGSIHGYYCHDLSVRNLLLSHRLISN